MRNAPEPNPDERAHSERLVAHIRAAIARAGGAIDFAEYMALALYAPGLGYYAAGKTKFGKAGDFTTAPELGSVYARCVASAVAPVLRATRGDFVELGAGSGAFAADVLEALAALDALPSRYRILETSADLRDRQRARLSDAWRDRVEWLDAPPDERWRGVLFANEVLDALPVQRFVARGEATAIETIRSDGDALVRGERPASAAEGAAIARLRTEPWPVGYRSEYLPSLDAWMRGVTQSLDRGLALFVDYGHPGRAYYDAARSDGTLICHYRHRAHGDPLFLPGLQDITAFVDFTAVAEAGVAAGLDFGAYLPQHAFLFASGLPAILAGSATFDAAAQATLAAEVKRLTLPAEMGETFKVIAFTRDYDVTTLPFARLDESARL